MQKHRNGKAHIIGGGIAGLASAVYLIRDGKMPGENVFLYEEGRDKDREEGRNALGGALDAEGDANMGYVMRGGRMFEERYVCTYDLLSNIPLRDNPNISAKDDIFQFSKEASWLSTARLIDRDAKPLDVSSMGFNFADRWALFRLLFLRSERSLGALRIDEVFPKHFFSTNFWLMWCTMFSFQPWHSAVEMRRYLLRFIHLFPTIADLSCVWHTRLNQYHSMILPIEQWLVEKGVKFKKGIRVLDMDFEPASNGYRVTKLRIEKIEEQHESEEAIGENDFVIFTNGSMTDASALGSKSSPAPLDRQKRGGAWALWKTLAEKQKGFGRPEAFIRDIDGSKWLSFTVTTKTPLFRDLLKQLTGRIYGREGLITFKESNWLMTIHPYYYPAYPGQPEDAFVWWGYGLNPDSKGNFIQDKTMAECSGRELLEETFRLLHFDAHLDELMEQSNVIPCMMPYITSQFMPREKGDRPEVIPEGSENFAFVGQYAEAPDDVVFTVEYSVRTAHMAVKSLLGLDVEIPPIYKGYKKLSVLWEAAWVSLR